MRKIIFLLLLCFNSAYSQYGWHKQNSLTTNLVSGVCMQSNTKAFAVGFSGLIRSTTNGGQTWSIRTTGISANLHKICFVNSSVGTIIGQAGLILYTSDGGNGWTQVPSGTTEYLNDLTFVAVGGERTLTGFTVGTIGTILKTTTGGASWNPQTSGTSLMLVDVSFLDYNTGYIVGFNGTVLKTTNGGVNWSPRNTGMTNINNYAVTFLNENTGFIAGASNAYDNGYILKTTNGGVNWTVKLSNLGNLGFTTIYGHTSNIISVGGTSGIILRSNDEGNTWTIQPNQSTEFLYDIDFSDLNNGMAVGKNGTIVRTESGGLVGISASPNLIPETFNLKQNYPNPFNPSTLIRFDIPENGFYSLEVFDSKGSKINTLFSKTILAGSYSIQFDGSSLSSGIYFYRLSGLGSTITKNMILIK